jgi:chromosome segregation ATPase
LQREKQELQEQMKARDQELSGYRISVTELEGKIREVETDRDRRNRDMGSQIARLSQEKEQLKQQLEERQSSLSALEGETADQKSLKSELKQQEDEIQRLRAESR